MYNNHDNNNQILLKNIDQPVKQIYIFTKDLKMSLMPIKRQDQFSKCPFTSWRVRLICLEQVLESEFHWLAANWVFYKHCLQYCNIHCPLSEKRYSISQMKNNAKKSRSGPMLMQRTLGIPSNCVVLCCKVNRIRPTAVLSHSTWWFLWAPFLLISPESKREVPGGLLTDGSVCWMGVGKLELTCYIQAPLLLLCSPWVKNGSSIFLNVWRQVVMFS